jgi:hypothetical protein
METSLPNQEATPLADTAGIETSASGKGAQRPADATALLPITNRGVIMAKQDNPPITVGLHWLAITLHSNPRAVATFVLDRLIGEFNVNPDEWLKHFVDTGISGRRYKGIYRGPYDIGLYGYPRLGTHCHVEVKGEAIDQIGQLRMFEFLESVPELKAPLQDGQKEQMPARYSARRIDIAFDHAPFSPLECYSAFLRRDIRCKASRKSYKWISNDDGDTLYLGSKYSPRMVRIYNQRGFTRVEIQFRGKWADVVGRTLVAQGCGNFETFAMGLLRDFVDFVEKDGEGSISRAALLPWWAAFVGDAAKGTLKPESQEYVGSAVTRASAYLQRMASTLCVLRDGLGISLDQLCDSQAHQLLPIHHHRIAELRRGIK